MGIRQLILALACGVGSASGRLDAAVLQAPRSGVNIDDALRIADSLRARTEFRLH